MAERDHPGDPLPVATTNSHRAEFIEELDRQIWSARAIIDGTADAPDTSPWWWIDEDDRVLLKLRLRGRIVQVNGTADTAILSDLEEVVAILEGVRRIVLAGRMDRQLRAVLDYR